VPTSAFSAFSCLTVLQPGQRQAGKTDEDHRDPTIQGLTMVWRCSCVARYWKNLKIVKPKAINEVLVRIHAVNVRSLAVGCVRRQSSGRVQRLIGHVSIFPPGTGRRTDRDSHGQ